MSTAKRRKARMQLIQEVIEASKVSAAQLAKDANLSEDALYSWTSGRREPQPESLHQLADGLRARADIIRALADKLERAAK